MANGQFVQNLRTFLLEPTFADRQGMAPDDVARRRALAEALWSQGNSSRPVVGVLDGANRVLQSFLGGRQMRKAEDADQFIRQRDDQQQQAGLQQMARFAYPDQTAPSTVPAAPQTFGAGSQNEWSTGDWPGGTGQQQAPASQQEFIDMMMPYALEASQRTGIDPRIIIAQSAQETGWGQHAPGNNYFGIKSHGQAGGNSLSTTEFVNGAPVTIEDSFRAYGSPAESVAGYADFMLQNGRYEPMRTAQGLDAQLAALGQSGYATDPGYANSVGQIARGINVPTANPVGEFVQGLISNPQTRGVATQLISDQITRLTTPPAPQEPYTLGANETRFDANNRPVAQGQGTGGGYQERVIPRAEYEAMGLPALPASQVWIDTETGPVVRGANEAAGVTPGALRTEIRQLQSYKNYYESLPIYQSMLSAAGTDDKAADLNLVYGLAKIFDPTSVVREGEQVLVRNAAGLPDQLVGWIDGLNGGGALEPSVRAAIMAQAYSRVTAYQNDLRGQLDFYGGVAQRNNIPTEDLYAPLGELRQWSPGAAGAATVPGAAPAPAAAGPTARPVVRAGDPAIGPNGELLAFDGVNFIDANTGVPLYDAAGNPLGGR